MSKDKINQFTSPIGQLTISKFLVKTANVSGADFNATFTIKICNDDWDVFGRQCCIDSIRDPQINAFEKDVINVFEHNLLERCENFPILHVNKSISLRIDTHTAKWKIDYITFMLRNGAIWKCQGPWFIHYYWVPLNCDVELPTISGILLKTGDQYDAGTKASVVIEICNEKCYRCHDCCEVSFDMPETGKYIAYEGDRLKDCKDHPIRHLRSIRLQLDASDKITEDNWKGEYMEIMISNGTHVKYPISQWVTGANIAVIRFHI